MTATFLMLGEAIARRDANCMRQVARFRLVRMRQELGARRLTA